ncbi:ketosteroid isomerase-like protein [Parvibaculum indicum]|uniref:nuclear transport factor 2 family protein n=1 Tax=Parvibaculum indicum TaxID=562969 RepID=UPI001423475A|nr:nuclear transport factor 2 family protein [Parvibaculum indicum]NIJ43438.1 ketosteroid isomerase-like protein [Parvibaculum indicum]
MTTITEESLVAAALSFVRAVEQMNGQEMEGYFAPDVQQIEMPNVFKPSGETRDLNALKAGIEKAKGVIEQQRFDILKTIASGDMVVLEMLWHGTVVADLPALPKGQKLKAHCVAIFEFKEGQVIRLRNYDCFDAI